MPILSQAFPTLAYLSIAKIGRRSPRPERPYIGKTAFFIAYIQSGKRAAFIEAEANEHPRPKDAPEGYAPKTKYPDWRHLVPTVSPDTVARNINVNAKILLNLQDALGLNSVSVSAPKSASGPMFVQSTSEQDEEHVGQYGIIMPIVSDR